jgi:hypothetical protein
MRRGEIGKSEQRLIGDDSFLTILGGLLVDFDHEARIDHETYL